MRGQGLDCESGQRSNHPAAAADVTPPPPPRASIQGEQIAGPPPGIVGPLFVVCSVHSSPFPAPLRVCRAFPADAPRCQTHICLILHR